MHLMIPFASVLSEAGQQAIDDLNLPHLEQLLARSSAAERDGGDEYSLSPPHERALARALGLSGGDGSLPWGAWHAVRDGLDPGDLAFGLLTPVHWQLAADHVNLIDPLALELDEGESRALFDAVRSLFESDGWLLAYGAPLRWYAAHASLAELPCASIDRVIGRDVDLWLTKDRRAREVRRLQNEVQMLLHRHPVNEQREARGALPVNSFWLSGCGVRQAVSPDSDVLVDDRLRGPALAEDWSGWIAGWHALDAGPLREALQRAAVTLTLCGERHAQCFETHARTLWSRITRQFQSPRARLVLEAL